VSLLEAFSQTTLLQICFQTMATKAKKETDSTAVYITETVLLDMLPTGSNVTEEASLYDNHTSLNVTSPYLNNFYFYKVSHLFINQSLDTCVSQSVNKSVSEQSHDRSLNQTSITRLLRAAHRCHCLLRRKGVTQPSCFGLPLVVGRHFKCL
jgi:hypothetical protein